MASITGKTDLYLIPGDPVTNVRLPRMFNAVFERCGIDAVMVPVQVRARDFAVWLKASFLGHNVRGMLIAPPHKPLAVDLLDGCGLFARVAGSVNIVRRTKSGELEGDLFDGEGIVGALDWFGIPFRGQRVLILGAGVSAAAIGVSLAEGGGDDGARHIAFYDPAAGKAAGTAARIDAAFDAEVVAAASADPSGYDLVINATQVGLQGEETLPCDVARLAPHAAVFDILLRGQPTPLVRAARARGLQAQPGFEMLIQQMAHYFDYFDLPQAAALVREDAGFLRQIIYPAELQAEIAQAPRGRQG
ncbi:shikimate dehydrogenase family protein [Pseudacidovorax intermedius]|uniref:Shikimate dehydrogenase n=1 Tax=Pseudacidovorax intermedius TaxID=433924 RepID=A0A147GPJ4_9BURK|nr:shikimate dehydrogenase [Pseudacidovorax intermedius]KTT16125.1 shikimate dehydrogenase [Pseudacidovorax intermedius]